MSEITDLPTYALKWLEASRVHSLCRSLQKNIFFAEWSHVTRMLNLSDSIWFYEVIYREVKPE